MPPLCVFHQRQKGMSLAFLHIVWLSAVVGEEARLQKTITENTNKAENPKKKKTLYNGNQPADQLVSSLPRITNPGISPLNQ